MTETRPLVSINNVSFYYGSDQSTGEWVLRDVSLDIFANETVALIGPNGSGKSTLAKLINGLLKPCSGKVIVDGLNPADDDDVWSVRERVGMVFQNPDNQIVAPTVRDDIAFGLENLGLPRSTIVERIDEAITRVGLTGMEHMAPNHLSGGQKQRLAIAGVLAMRPKLIIMDEATTMLDPQARQEVADAIRLVKEDGISVMIVTHALEETWEADRVIVMVGGTIPFIGSPQEVFARGSELLSWGLDIPFSVTMQKEMIKQGLPLTDDIMDDKSLVNTLWTLWQKT